MYVIIGKLYFLYHFHSHNCFVDCWTYDLLHFKLVTHYCFLYFKFLTAFATFHVEVLTMWCIVITIKYYCNTVLLLHFIAASLADGCTQQSLFAITTQLWTRIWNYIWNRACVFCCCIQVCHLCYYLSMSTLSVVQLFHPQFVLSNLTTI